MNANHIPGTVIFEKRKLYWGDHLDVVIYRLGILWINFVSHIEA